MTEPLPALGVAALALLLALGATEEEALAVLDDLATVAPPPTSRAVLEQLRTALAEVRART